MPRPNFIDWIAIVLVILGALNWGLVGLFGFDLVMFIFGALPILVSIIYVIFGLAGLWMLFFVYRMATRPTPMTR